MSEDRRKLYHKEFESIDLYFCLSYGQFWIRWFGTGFLIQNINKFPLLFSQRYGLSGKIIGNYYFERLKG